MQNITTIRKLALAGIVIAAFLSQSAAAQIYKYKDADGNVVFSDKRPAGDQNESVEEVKLGTTNSAQTPPNISSSEPLRKQAKPEAVVYETVITSPTDNTTISMGPGNFPVTALISPSLGANEFVQLTMDGAPIGNPQRSNSWQLSNVFRGEHNMIVQRINGGNVVNSSVPITVYVLRPSVR
ncbi:DUF4124 domain-containing protein [Luminiphilus sp.]|nr:DUF4124 domain-containing protein [Luminiphilus sp.]